MSETLKIVGYVFAALIFFGAVYAAAAWIAKLLGPVIDRMLTPLEFLDDPKRPSSPHHPARVRFGNQWFKAPPLLDAPAVFCGWQPSLPGVRPLELWNLKADIPGYPRGSTLSRRTLESAGYWVPIPPVPCPAYLSPKET